jgi:predicted nucleic acid-binding protein
VESFLRFAVLDTTTDLMLAAAATRQRFDVSYWDATILEGRMTWMSIRHPHVAWLAYAM